MAGELHRQVEVLIAEGVAPTEDDRGRSAAQTLTVLLCVQVGIELLDGPAAIAIAGLNEGKAVFVVAHELQSPEVTKTVAYLHTVSRYTDRIADTAFLLEVIGGIEIVAQ